MNSKKWLKIWFAFIIIIPTIGIMNYIVDPYDVFNNKVFKKFEYKDRISSSVKLDSYNYDTIIVGTSRTQGGIDVRNALFKGKVINASMSGSNVFEIHKVFNKIYTSQKDNVDIIYGLDFLTFNDKRLPSEQFKQSLYNKESSKENLLLSLLLSTDAMKSSLETVLKTIKGSKNENFEGYIEKNFNKNHNYESAFERILTNNFLVNKDTYGCYNYGKDRLELFEEIVKNSKNKNLFLFITPLHHRHIMALKHLGLFNQYIKWMYDLQTIVSKYNSNDGYNIKLYDFSYINFVTAEAVSDNVKYYWESSHYKSVVGNMIIDRLFGNEKKFGILLNNIDIKKYLSEYIKSYYLFFSKNQKTYLDVFSLYTKTTKHRINNCLQYNNLQTVLSRDTTYNPLLNLDKDKNISLNSLEY